MLFVLCFLIVVVFVAKCSSCVCCLSFVGVCCLLMFVVVVGSCGCMVLFVS